MIKRISIGIDPGSSSGAIAFIIEDESGKEYIEAAVMKELTEKGIYEKLRGVKEMAFPETKLFGVIEAVHAMPGQGVSSVFSFGKNYGALRMALICNGIPFNEDSPQKWMKYYSMKRDKASGESKPDWKKRLKQKAEQIYPEIDIKKDHADAILIAHYTKLNYNQ